MSFPASPYTGQTTIVNGVNYIYDGANNAWKRIPASIANLVISNTLTAANLAITSNNATIAGSPIVSLATVLAYQLAL